MARYDSLKKKNTIGPPRKTRIDRVGDGFNTIADKLETISCEVQDFLNGNEKDLDDFFELREKFEKELRFFKQIATSIVKSK